MFRIYSREIVNKTWKELENFIGFYEKSEQMF